MVVNPLLGKGTAGADRKWQPYGSEMCLLTTLVSKSGRKISTATPVFASVVALLQNESDSLRKLRTRLSFRILPYLEESYTCGRIDCFGRPRRTTGWPNKRSKLRDLFVFTKKSYGLSALSSFSARDALTFKLRWFILPRYLIECAGFGRTYGGWKKSCMTFESDPLHLVTTCPAPLINFGAQFGRQVGLGHARFRSLATYEHFCPSQLNVKYGARGGQHV